jgi:hypothetical protein
MPKLSDDVIFVRLALIFGWPIPENLRHLVDEARKYVAPELLFRQPRLRVR